jgi:hypothetical protein
VNDRDVLDGVDRRLSQFRDRVPVPEKTTVGLGRAVVTARITSVLVPAILLAAVVGALVATRTGAPRPSDRAALPTATEEMTEVPTAVGERSETPAPSPSAAVDPAIRPVSRSRPGPEAKHVLDLCNADYYGLDAIAGMGKVAHARDVPNYVPLLPTNPELKDDKPAWVVEFQGRFDLQRGLGWALDPVCVVIDGEPILFLPNGAGLGEVTPPPRERPQPTLALPSLAP